MEPVRADVFDKLILDPLLNTVRMNIFEDSFAITRRYQLSITFFVTNSAYLALFFVC